MDVTQLCSTFFLNSTSLLCLLRLAASSLTDRLSLPPEPTDVVSAASSRASPESGVFAVDVFGLVPSLSRPQNSPDFRSELPIDHGLGLGASGGAALFLQLAAESILLLGKAGRSTGDFGAAKPLLGDLNESARDLIRAAPCAFVSHSPSCFCFPSDLVFTSASTVPLERELSDSSPLSSSLLLSKLAILFARGESFLRGSGDGLYLSKLSLETDLGASFLSIVWLGLCSAINELELSSEVGEMSGVVGVTEPGLKEKNVSTVSSKRAGVGGRRVGRDGALVLARRGRPFTKCCNCCDGGASSQTESNDSSADVGSDGNKSGMSSADIPSILSTTDFGRNFLPCKLFRFVDRCGVAIGEGSDC